MNQVEKYYNDQALGLPHFSGAAVQRGHGLGGIFGSLFRAAVPLFKKATPFLKSAAKTVANEAVKSGVDILDDVLDGESIKDAVANRGKQGANRLAKRGVKRLRHIVSHPKTIKRKRRAVNDIFG
ncbi:MAG: hypothetical protein ACR2M9_01030 [Cyanophyceae cyanobacterium]